MRLVFGLDRVCNHRDEAVLVLFVEPCPLTVGIELQKPQLAVLADEVEASESVAGLVHEAFDGAFFRWSEFAARPDDRVLYDGFPGVVPVERISRCVRGVGLAVDIDDRHFLLAVNPLLYKPRIGNIESAGLDLFHEENLVLAYWRLRHCLDDPSAAFQFVW